MRVRPPSFILFVLSMLVASLLHAAPKYEAFSFTVIGQRGSVDDVALLDSLKHASEANAAFVVLNGIRPRLESCHDDVYLRRSKLLADSGLPVILSLASTDWADCVNEKGQSIAQDRLEFLRGVLLEKNQSSHVKQLMLTKQSSSAIYRQYSENVRWESNGVLFATINLPSSNNHYLSAAGRNNEFEDRLIANRHWQRRIFSQAKYRKMKAIVLFVDGNPMLVPARTKQKERRDGFLEMRKHLATLAAKYPGKVLLVHGQRSSRNIVWRRNFGVVGAGGKNGLHFTVQPGAVVTFSVKRVDPGKNGAASSASAKN